MKIFYQTIKRKKNILLKDVIISFNEKSTKINGSNGVGKSTLLYKIYKDNFNQITFISQDVYLLENLTIKQNLKLFKCSDLKIPFNKTTKVSQLSGGMKKFLYLQMCFYKINTPFVIIDEPFNHLDVDKIEFIKKQIKDLKQTVIFVDHLDLLKYDKEVNLDAFVY